MFTGLVERLGTLAARSVRAGAGKLKIKPETRFEGLELGESMAVNGACLTLEKELPDGSLVFHALEETFKKTNLGALRVGGKVNLERAMRLGDRLGGHLVSGHVDATAKLKGIGKAGADTELSIELPESLAPFMIDKGSVCVDGVSLTIVKLRDDRFTVNLIPTTWKATALRFRKPGDKINLEGDVVGKYVQRQMRFAAGGAEGEGSKPWSGISMDDLKEAGF